jgi:hypothetical protein
LEIDIEPKMMRIHAPSGWRIVQEADYGKRKHIIFKKGEAI